MTENVNRRCEAPGCIAFATHVATGVDFDGEPFSDAVCDGCGGYLVECGATLAPIRDAIDYAIGLRRVRMGP